MRHLLLIPLLVFLNITPALAKNLELNLGEHSAQAKYNSAVGGTNYGRSELNFGVLYNNDYQATVAELALLVVDNAGARTPGLEIGIGPKVWFAKRNDDTAVAVAIGARMKYKLGMDDRLFTRARLFYAPSIVSFSDANKMWEISGELGYEILPTADGYFGYRVIEAEFPLDSNKMLDNSAYFGIRIEF